MERRLAITYAVSATATLCTACVAVATVSGGLFVQAAPALNGGIKQVENIDEYIVVHSPASTDPASTANSVVAQALVGAGVAESTTTAAPEPAPVPVVAIVQPMAPAVADASETETSDPESDDANESEADDTETDDTTPHVRFGDHHHSDDGHESDDDHEHEGGDD